MTLEQFRSYIRQSAQLLSEFIDPEMVRRGLTRLGCTEVEAHTVIAAATGYILAASDLQEKSVSKEAN